MSTLPLRLVIVSLLLATVACASGPPERGTAAATGGRLAPGLSYPAEEFVLGNGLRVIVVPTGERELVSLQIAVGTGSRNEVEAGKSGFAHFFEHMMFRGSEHYSAEDYNRIITRIGGDQNAYTTDDYTNYHITFNHEDLPTVMEVEADRFQHLKFSEAEFRTEALAVKGEYLKNFSDPSNKLWERMRELAFRVHPYRHTTMGFFRDIEAMPDQYAYALEFYRRWYRPDNTVMIVAGAVDPAQIEGLVKRYWGAWRPGTAKVTIPQEPPPQGPVHDHIRWQAPTAPQLWLAFHAPAFARDPLAVAALQALGEIWFSDTSELYQQLVVQEARLDRLGFAVPLRTDPNLAIVQTRLRPGTGLDEIRAVLVRTLVRIRTEPVPEARLERVKDAMRFRLLGSVRSAADLGALLARYAHFDRSPQMLRRHLEAIAALTPADLARVAEQVFTDAGRVTISLSNGPAPAALGQEPDLAAAVRARRDQAPAFRLTEMPSDSPLVDVQLVFRTGSAEDPRGAKGLARLTTAMIARGGSRLRPMDQLERDLKPTGGDLWFRVDKEQLSIGGTVHRDRLTEWYAILRERLLQPGWRKDEFRHLRDALISAIRNDLRGNNDEELGKEVLYQFIYGPEHPYGQLNAGVIADIEGFEIGDLVAFRDTHLVQERLTVGLAGGYPPDFAARLRQDLAALPHGEARIPELPPPPPVQGRSAVIVAKETPATAVSFGFPISIRRGDPDWVGLWLIRSWLGEHRSMASHLFQVIREARGMNYGDYAYIEYFPGGMFQFHPDTHRSRRQQIFQVWLRPLRTPNDAVFATRAAIREIDRLLADGLSEEEFQRTRDFLYRYVAVLAQTQGRRLGYRIDGEFYGTGPFVDYVRKGLKDLTREQVNRIARRHLQTRNLKLVYVTRDAAALREILASGAPTPIHYNSPKPPALLAEDRIIAGLPLDIAPEHIQILPAETLFEHEDSGPRP